MKFVAIVLPLNEKLHNSMRCIVFVFMLASLNTYAQCTLTWGHFVKGSLIEKKENLRLNNYVIGPDSKGYIIPKSLLDSLIIEVKFRNTPDLAINIIDSNGIKFITTNQGQYFFDPNFEIFILKGRDIVHYGSKKYLIDTDSIEVHEFSYCDSEWNEDLLQNTIQYTKQFGIIAKYIRKGMGYGFNHDYHLINNSCLNKEDNKKINILNSIIKRR